MGAFLMLSADVRFGVAGPWRIGMNEVAIGMTVPKFAVELARHRLTPPGFARITTARDVRARRRPCASATSTASSTPTSSTAPYEEEARRLRALDMPSFAATKARINERALRAIRAALDDEMRAVAA